MENDNISTTENQSQEIKKEQCCEHKHCKCCLNLILNIVAIVGVIILFVLYFTGGSGSSRKSNSNLAIGFVNSDSVMDNYDLVKNAKTALLAKQKEAEDSFALQQQTFEAQVTQYQNAVKANTLSITAAQNTEKILMQRQESLLALKDELSQKLADEELKLNVMLTDSIVNYVKRYNKKHNYDFILGYSKGSGILYANDSLELTKDVLDGLNKEYKSKK